MWSVRPLTLAVGVIAILALSAGCAPMGGQSSHHQDMHGGGDDTRSEQPVQSSEDLVVEIADFAFIPGNIQVTVGTSVTWVNRDVVQHTATAADGSWDAGFLAQDESSTVQFDTPGVYDYSCLPHPNMKARVEVVAA